MRILELFAGIGACSKALERLGIDVEIVDAVEIDKYAMASFNAIHGTQFSVSDIRDWDKDIKGIDLITHGSPCQDFSIAGKQAGGDLGSGTRSSLMYETIRIVGKIRPKYVLWENVKNILSKKHKHNFDSYIETMNILGYNSYYKVLNAKDYGIPQNRERVYTVSIRKDIDMGYKFPQGEKSNNTINKVLDLQNNYEQQGRVYGSDGLSPTIMSNSHNGGYIAPKILIGFKFPDKEELKLRLKDMLEDEVDEKYYLSDKFINGLLKHNEHHREKGTGFIWKPRDLDGVASTLRSNGALCPTDNTIKCVQVAQMYGTAREPNPQAGRIYDSDGLSPTVDSCNGGNRMPKVLISKDKPINSMGVVERINKNAKHQQDLVQSQDDICRVIPAGTHGSTPHLLKTIVNENPLRIRKLTPKECWRLMGFDDEDFEKAERVPTSNTQLYKQAGNSIVVNVLENIFKNLF